MTILGALAIQTSDPAFCQAIADHVRTIRERNEADR